ncbi:iron-containing redox enzyme family protein [Roseibium sp.]|uniref:iron-containing redox enzyme family protein n=1 Tax=Roseibium sp. TaxID=1936156 RepID=UPI003B52F117
MKFKKEIDTISKLISRHSGQTVLPEYDLRIDSIPSEQSDNIELYHLVLHQVLFRCYQGRYVLLPKVQETSMEEFNAYHDLRERCGFSNLQSSIEKKLITPEIGTAYELVERLSFLEFLSDVSSELDMNAENEFITFLENNERRKDYYRNFLLQSSSDLLAEASASALGVVGDYGPAQSVLFRVLIDEFGYGSFEKKHSSLFRSTLEGFHLSTNYNHYWYLFDINTFKLHNFIHHLFQNPRNFFLQLGFLIYAESSYQKSTKQNYLYLKRHHPEVDSTYFAEHAHIDIHHSSMVLDEVAIPLAEKFGRQAEIDIMAGISATQQTFKEFGNQLLNVSKVFNILADSGAVSYGLDESISASENCFTPSMMAQTIQSCNACSLQVGGIGALRDPSDFCQFPPGTLGRETRQ